ncbi:transporter associated domain-containing protein [Streptomyces globosus]|uniref:transporter associated domain-containing protein n=1 Tax=Streptomyces globosus TaxID=68209 RepID=UPI003D164134
MVPGWFPVRDLPDIGVELGDLPGVADDGRCTTVAGLVLHRLGRIPSAPGTRILADERILEVTIFDHNAITEVRISRAPATQAGPTGDRPQIPDRRRAVRGDPGKGEGAASPGGYTVRLVHIGLNRKS